MDSLHFKVVVFILGCSSSFSRTDFWVSFWEIHMVHSPSMTLHIVFSFWKGTDFSAHKDLLLDVSVPFGV